MGTTKTGLDILEHSKEIQSKIKGNVAYLCNSASVNSKLVHGIYVLKKIFGSRFTKIFGPQHGFSTDLQDNMIETPHAMHPYFKIPIYSLYSEPRKPSREMLEDIDCMIIDLQDVGTRIYTYIWTMVLTMQECVKNGIKLIILDRPNPVNGLNIEGNICEPDFFSFVGIYEFPMRHGMTIAEVSNWANKIEGIDCDLEIVCMKNWKRDMYFTDTALPFVLPSPNLPTPESCIVYPGSVLFEGTNMSEGRGTTRSLEIIGSPDLEPWKHLSYLKNELEKAKLTGVTLRPLVFVPTFDKFQGEACGGYQIHINNLENFKPWATSQFLMQRFFHLFKSDDFWNTEPYEYTKGALPIDWINGSAKIRHWIESDNKIDQLFEIENANMKEFLKKRKEVLLYS